MNVLMITHQLLFRESKVGSAKRLYYLASELTRYADLTMVCMDGCFEHAEFRKYPAEFERFLHLETSSIPRRPLAKLRPLADASYAIARRREELLAFLGQRSYDAALLCYPFARSFLELQTIRRIGNITYLEDDLLFESMKKEVAVSGSLPKRAWKYLRYHQLKHDYLRKLSRVRKFVSISEQERRIVKQWFPHMATFILKYCLSGDYYSYLSKPHCPYRLGFIGNFTHKPNLDALTYFLSTVYPTLRSSIAETSLLVAGRPLPKPLVQQYSSDSSIEWRDDFEDVRDFYRNVSVLVNPSVSGRGLRTKVVEAAACGRPIISTALGAEGLEDMRIELAENPEEFRKSVLRLSTDPQYYNEVVTTNQSVYKKAYTIQSRARDLFLFLMA
jgi:glycosyltransferase involved in cell wall biosynthesis